MDIRSVVPLDAASLIASAERATGFTDFGGDEWREPFEVLTTAMNEEAGLNLMGRIRTRSELLQLLEARLRIEDAYRQHPEIEDEEIVAPLVIVGQSRSGTSMLHNVLSLDPRFGAPKHWEMVFPCPPPEAATYLTDPRIEKAHRLVDQWRRVTPTLASMHEFAGDLPMEDCVILGMSFMSPSWFDSMGQVPSYDAYMATCDMTPALAYHRRVLKLLQWRNPRKRWVLKDPTHLDRVEALLTVYPDACLIWPHRDPSEALSSVVSLLGTVQWGRCDQPFKNGSFEYILDPVKVAERFDGFIDKIEAGVIPAGQLFNIPYAELVRAPIDSIGKMYDFFSIPFTPEAEQAMRDYLTSRPRSSRPAHAVQEVPEDIKAADRKAFERYCSYFNISLGETA